MGNVTVVIRREWHDLRIGLSKHLLSKLFLLGKHRVSFRIGQSHRSASLSMEKSSDLAERLYISPNLAKSAGLTNYDRVKVKMENGSLVIGPLIGIFADHHSSKSSLFGEQTKFLRELLLQARDFHYFIYVFDALDIDWERQLIGGYVLSTGNGGNPVWQRRKFPFPQVVYDRCIVTKLSSNSKNVKSRLGEKVPFFNRRMGDKWLMHERYSQIPAIAPHLPETKEFKSSLLEPWLKKYKILYIKPCLGTQGKGIIRVTYQKNEYVAQRISSGGQATFYRTTSISALRIKVISWVKGLRYVIQQGIPLAKTNGRNYDVRVLIQKGTDGGWEITGMVARVGKQGSAINNVHGGGDVLSVEKALASSFPNNRMLVSKIISDLNQVSLDVCRESEVKGSYLGELGVDLGIDVDGKVWYIEVNPKPGRSVFTRLQAVKLRRKSVIQPMHYAAFVAGFTNPLVSEGEDVYETS